MLHLIGVTGLFDEDQMVFCSCRHMTVQIAQKLNRIAIREVIIGSYQQSTGVRNHFGL